MREGERDTGRWGGVGHAACQAVSEHTRAHRAWHGMNPRARADTTPQDRQGQLSLLFLHRHRQTDRQTDTHTHFPTQSYSTHKDE